jgi:sulfate adenylyltransferase subunit 1
MSHTESGLLKFITCGSVDDGKSTLIGHILYDSKMLYADQEQALMLDSQVGSRNGAIDYSLLLDGLMAEREQGITIDVAYPTSTPKGAALSLPIRRDMKNTPVIWRSARLLPI